MLDCEVQPLASVTTALKEPDVLTLIVASVELLLQTILFGISDDNCTEDPLQIAVGPFAEIIGAVGNYKVLITAGSEVELQPLISVTVTV